MTAHPETRSEQHESEERIDRSGPNTPDGERGMEGLHDLQKYVRRRDEWAEGQKRKLM